jgi:hypothetical protein
MGRQSTLRSLKSEDLPDRRPSTLELERPREMDFGQILETHFPFFPGEL